MMDFDQANRLARLQARIWSALGEALREDGHRKSSDGIIEVSYLLPAAFDWDARPTWQVTIHSYVLCEGASGKLRRSDAGRRPVASGSLRPQDLHGLGDEGLRPRGG